MLAALIVSDDLAFQTVLRTVFERGGFDNCTEAVNAYKIKQLSPNLVVVDAAAARGNGMS
jgi:ActR/RegA family two-component response regulator